MASPVREVRGLTVLELLVTVFVIAVLAWFALPTVYMGPCGNRSWIRWENNARAIHMATMAMAYDSKTNHDSSLGWPGDLKADGKISTLSDFVNVLVRHDYLKSGDLKVFSDTGFIPYRGVLSSGSAGVLTPAFKDENSAFKVFLVKESDSANTVFLASKNYTYNGAVRDSNARSREAFVVCHKDGSATILKRQQAQSLNLIGVLPGGATVESAENCLNPDPKAP